MNDPPVTAVAPARVSIIGEHTDYNDGLVLPTCTALFTRVTATKRGDRKVHANSATLSDQVSFDLSALAPGRSSGWIEYVKGVAAGLRDAGVVLHGADLIIDGDIPLGMGLSSSASLELAAARALLAVADTSIAADELALLCQRAEHEYAGVKCGIMDQYALACAESGNALFLDCRSMQTRQVPIPGELAFILTDSGVRHKLTDGNYNDRADECAAAVRILATADRAVRSLRDVNSAMLDRQKPELGPVLYRRCRHVLAENQRVLDMIAALGAADLVQVGALLTACHASLKNDYEVSCPPIDRLVENANSSDLVLGSRIVGGGFGGCVLSACHVNDVAAAAAHIRDSYAEAKGEHPWQHQVTPAQPVRIVEG